jgi:hypothetical protein
MSESTLIRHIEDAILGIDTLWGGDVMNSSGTGRFIADSWCSDEPLPDAYTHRAAGKLRKSGGVSAGEIDVGAVDAYLDAVDVPAAIASLAGDAKAVGGLRGAYLSGLAECFGVMWELVQELLGRGEPVPYERCVPTVTGKPPSPSQPEEKRRRVAELLARAGHPSKTGAELLAAVDAWRSERLVPRKSIKALASAFIGQLDAQTAANMMPHLPAELSAVPRANIAFLPIENAWFSGSMNYLGRARRPDGSPEYDATYEINAALSISIPEFQQLISHEVVPGHVTTFAFLQNLYVRGVVGFEATVLTMNTRAACLYEGLANNAVLMACGAKTLDELPDEDLQIGVLLALLQDDAKNQSSYLTWKEMAAQKDVAAVLRRDFLVSDERADKLSGAWGRHPLLGRMYLPAYRAGTLEVARLREKYPPERLLPALYGCRGLVDVTTIERAIEAG